MADVIETGSVSFDLDVSFQLIGPEEAVDKPVIIYLHGFQDNITGFRRNVAKVLDLPVYHLLIQGPYPLYDRSREKEVEEWGRAWYLYDGNRQQFIRSMERSSQLVEKVLKQVESRVDINRRCLLGYSMGGYLAGYFTLSRPRLVDDLIVIGGRIKSEIFEGKPSQFDHLQVLALHGSRDKSVDPDRQEDSVEKLKKWGAETEFRLLDAGHRMSTPYVDEAIKWLKKRGYE